MTDTSSENKQNKLYLRFPPLSLAELERSTRIMPKKLPLLGQEPNSNNNQTAESSKGNNPKRSRIMPQKLPIINIDTLGSRESSSVKRKKKLLPVRLPLYSGYPGTSEEKAFNSNSKKKDNTFAKPNIRKPLWKNSTKPVNNRRSSLLVSKKAKNPQLKKFNINKKITKDILKGCDVSQIGILEDSISESSSSAASSVQNTNLKKKRTSQISEIQRNCNTETFSTPDSLLNFEYQEKTFQVESAKIKKNDNVNEKVQKLSLSIYNDHEILKQLIESINPDLADLIKGVQQKALLISKLVTNKENVTPKLENIGKSHTYCALTPKIQNLEISGDENIAPTPHLGLTLVKYNKLKKSSNILETPKVVITGADGVCKREIQFRNKSANISKKVLDQLNELY